MPELLTVSLAVCEDKCLQAATEHRYIAEQLERTARMIRSGRLAQAEQSFKAAMSGYERADATWNELEAVS